MPPEPEPSRFSDWSSLGSPPARTSPHGAPGVQTEPSENAQNQLNVSTTGETRQERIEISNCRRSCYFSTNRPVERKSGYTCKTCIIA